jgi:hypothetical protein
LALVQFQPHLFCLQGFLILTSALVLDTDCRSCRSSSRRASGIHQCLQGSQASRTWHLAKLGNNMSMFISSHFITFFIILLPLLPFLKYMCHGRLAKTLVSVHFEWPPLPPLASPWDRPLGKVSRCMYTSLRTMHKPNPVRYPQGNFEPNEHVSASSRCHLPSIQ